MIHIKNNAIPKIDFSKCAKLKNVNLKILGIKGCKIKPHFLLPEGFVSPIKKLNINISQGKFSVLEFFDSFD